MKGFQTAGRSFFFLLFVAFAASFALPFLFAGRLINLFSSPPLSNEEQEVFPDISAISPGGSWIEIPGNVDYWPRADRDFLITGWFKPRGIPASDQRLVLLSSVKKVGLRHEGFGLALSADGGKWKPEVFWADGKGRGGWKEFLPMELSAQRWFMFAISFYKGRYLGLHWAKLNPGRKTRAKLSGGYEFGQSVLPAGMADITMGSRGKEGFRGKLGPLAVMTPPRLHKDLPKILSDVLKYPGELPESVDLEDVRLWVRGGKVEIPQGELAGKVEMRSVRGKMGKKKAVRKNP